MVVKGTSTVVKTASADFEVKDGVMLNRDESAASCAGGNHCPLRVALANGRAKLESTLPDENWAELKSLKVVNGTSWVHLAVNAVSRFTDSQSTHGSIIVIYTHGGEVSLDGASVSFSERLEDTFSRAGFTSVHTPGTSKRRLLETVDIVGTFNALSP